jgi:DNA polymerase III subunit gamma/tau
VSRVGYQALYRKYRSQSFGDLVGQEATARALRGAIATDHVAHAYLFSGTRGTGKTTTARLLAKAINCLHRAPGASEPCNECDSCIQVQNGSALDLVEIDAASNRGIDEIRDLREKVNLAPALGRRKVYIIDEAHMLTTEAFNALLKTLEEPPEHVVFVLCTTEANKVPLTVLGRCQQFVFRRFNDGQIIGRLTHIADAEGIPVEREALALMAHVAQGSMRDAVGLLDQLVPLTEGTITLATARDLLGITDPGQLDELVDLVLAGRAGEALEALGRIYEGGGELRQVVRGLMERCRDRLVRAIEDGDAAARERLSTVLDALLHLDGEVRRHAEPRFLVEAALVRLAVEAARAAQPVPAANASSPVPVPVQPPVAAAAPPTEVSIEAPDSAPAGQSQRPADRLGRWSEVTRQIQNAYVKAVLMNGTPEIEGARLIIWFKHESQVRSARESEQFIATWATGWLGKVSGVEFRQSGELTIKSTAVPTAGTAPEEAPVIKAAERTFEGRVVKVQPLKEAP